MNKLFNTVKLGGALYPGITLDAPLIEKSWHSIKILLGSIQIDHWYYFNICLLFCLL